MSKKTYIPCSVKVMKIECTSMIAASYFNVVTTSEQLSRTCDFEEEELEEGNGWCNYKGVFAEDE
ncbi:hypothetical protein L6472_00245 [Prevotella sp. E13-17]|uniref:hypothetical protein n=1 Tax=Prevotella sp. E13-17 TaxID=2913616 RepID=UPI001EDC686A|nr:hypothetical protein [Prevotella sp. E13-17]UKK51064.1 hypothetical protein L6472_00245 [Prevotella sp. E13-17]